MPEPLDLLMSMAPAELLALEQMGGTPNLPPDAIDRALRMQGYRTGQRPGQKRAAGAAIPMDPGLAGLVQQIYGGIENEMMIPPPPDYVPPAPYYDIPEAPPPPAPPSGQLRPEGLRGGRAPAAPEPPPPPAPPRDPRMVGRNPIFEFLPPETIMAGVERQVQQGTPASALPGDLAQTGGFNVPPPPMAPPEKPGAPVYTGPPAPPEKPPGLVSLMAPPMGGVPAPAGMPGSPAPTAPPVGPPGTAPDPIATGAAAAQQAAAASATQQAQTADPFAGLPEPLANALREYQAIAADLRKQDESAKWMALAKAGFAMAGSRSPSFFGALGEGGMAGLEAYEAAQAAEAQRRMQAAGMDMTVGNTLMNREAALAAAARQAEQDALEAEYKRARIGSLNRSNRGGGGGSTGQQGITQSQYLTMVQREADNLMNSAATYQKYRADPEAARRDAMANVDAYLSESGITVRGMGGGGGGGGPQTLSAVAGAAPEDLGAPDQYNEGDVVQAENGSMWVVLDGQYQPYEP